MEKIIKLNGIVGIEENELPKVKEENIIEENNQYCKKMNPGLKRLSNFIINPLELIKTKEGSVFKVEIYTDEYDEYETTLKTIDFSSVSALKRALCKTIQGLSFKVNNSEFEDIKELIGKKKYSVKTAIDCIGLIKNDNKYLFIAEDRVVDEFGEVDSKYVLSSGINKIQTKIAEIEPISKEGLEDLSKYMFGFNNIDVTATMWGFCCGCFLKEKLWAANNTKFNHLIIAGEAGAGKSETLERIMMKFFSTSTFTSADQITSFVNAKMSTSSNTIPYIIDEYKPHKLKKSKKDDVSAIMRSSYNREYAFRGTKEQEINAYMPLAPIVLIGEAGIDETANEERSLTVMLSKSNINNKNKEKCFMEMKRKSELIASLGRSVLNEALKININTIIERQIKIDEYIVDKLPSRVKNSIINCCLGLMMLKDAFDNLNLDFKECTGYKLEELFDIVIESAKENILDANNNTRGIIEKTISIIDEMIGAGKLTKGEDYQLLKDGSELAIDLTGIYEKVIKYSKATGQADLLNRDQFSKQFKKKEFFGGYKAVVFRRNDVIRTKKAYTILLDKLGYELENIKN